MPDFQSFQRMIRTPEFWQADEADRNAYQLGLQEMVRMGMIVNALALEAPAAEPPRRRGRTPKSRQIRRHLTIFGDTERHHAVVTRTMSARWAIR